MWNQWWIAPTTTASLAAKLNYQMNTTDQCERRAGNRQCVQYRLHGDFAHCSVKHESKWGLFTISVCNYANADIIILFTRKFLSSLNCSRMREKVVKRKYVLFFFKKKIVPVNENFILFFLKCICKLYYSYVLFTLVKKIENEVIDWVLMISLMPFFEKLNVPRRFLSSQSFALQGKNSPPVPYD